MGLVTLTQISNGEDADATTVDSNFDAIAAELNGGLENVNIAAAAGIVGTKLNAARVSTTVGGLGTAADGALGLLRVGSSPYEHLAVVYDATYGKWVSAPRWTSRTPDGGTFDSTTTTYGATPCFAEIKNYKAIHDAGMRLQVAYSGIIFTSNTSHEARIGVNVYDFDDLDVPWATLTTGYDAQNTLLLSPGVIRARDSWAQPAITPTQTHGLVAIGLATQTVGQTCSARYLTLGYRFASA